MLESFSWIRVAALIGVAFVFACGSSADSGNAVGTTGASGFDMHEAGGGSGAAGTLNGLAGGRNVAGASPSSGAGGALVTGGSGGGSATSGGTASGGTASGGMANGGTANGGGMAGSAGHPGGGAGGMPSTTRLVHPGILHSATELAFVRAQVAAKAEPWASAFAALQKSSYASLSYAEKPYATVECGSYNKPNIGCSQIVDDGMAAYTQALLWNATGDIAHANKAIEIIDAWANVYQKTLQSNSNLVVGWATPWYTNAAEILRYSKSGWTSAVEQRFEHLLSLWLTYVDTDDGPQNNWMQSRIEAHLAIAVFFDDPAELAKAEARWNKYLPLYVLDSGLGGETCRDLGHLGLGIRSMMYAAETAWHQGTDSFGPNSARFQKFIELHGSWMLGKAAVPPTVCGGVVLASEHDTVGIQPPTGGGAMPLEILYAQLHGRLGMALPNLRDMLQAGRPVGAGHWVQKWETLMYGGAL